MTLENTITVESENDPLAKLYTDRTVSARELAEFLLSYIRIDPETLRVKFFSNIRLGIQQKTLLYYLALRVMNMQGLRETYKATPSQLAKDLPDINPSSVRPMMRMLVASHLLSYDEQTSEYYITFGQVAAVERYINELGI